MTMQSCDVLAVSHSVGLSVSLPESHLVVKEGDIIIIMCLPTSSSVAVQWDISISPAAHGTVEANAVEYDNPLIIHNANKSHQGNYTCRVVGDLHGVIPSATAAVNVRESRYH